MRILMIGDVFGKAGRQALRAILPKLIDKHRVDFVVANVENLAGGRGVESRRLKEISSLGINVFTTGNHVWHNKDVFDFIDKEKALLRPANYPEPCPGRGYTIAESAAGTRVAVINMMGRTFQTALDCPFRKMDAILKELEGKTKIILVDFHAEATSEKVALSWYLDGRVSAVAGTHTHVQTADERILPQGTAAISDLGMTGPHDSVIGMRKEGILENFLSRRPVSFTAASGDARFNGALLEVDEHTGRAVKIERVSLKLEENGHAFG